MCVCFEQVIQGRALRGRNIEKKTTCIGKVSHMNQNLPGRENIKSKDSKEGRYWVFQEEQKFSVPGVQE